MINIPRLPAGRYKKNCDPPESSGEAFRDDVLIPALKANDRVTVNLAPKYGMPVSWCEEVFGGLVRKLGADVVGRLAFKGNQELAGEAMNFMIDQVERDK